MLDVIRHIQAHAAAADRDSNVLLLDAQAGFPFACYGSENATCPTISLTDSLPFSASNASSSLSILPSAPAPSFIRADPTWRPFAPVRCAMYASRPVLIPPTATMSIWPPPTLYIACDCDNARGLPLATPLLMSISRSFGRSFWQTAMVTPAVLRRSARARGSSKAFGGSLTASTHPTESRTRPITD